MLPFLHKSKVRRNGTKFERRHWTELGALFNVSWHNGESFLVPPDERRRLFVATPPSLKRYKLCRTYAVPSIPACASKSNARNDEDDLNVTGNQQDVLLWAGMDDYIVMRITQFTERTWLWSRKRLKILPDFNVWMVEHGCGVPFPLL